MTRRTGTALLALGVLVGLAPAARGQAEWLGLDGVKRWVYRDGEGVERSAAVVRNEPAAGDRPACIVVEEGGSGGTTELWYAGLPDGLALVRKTTRNAAGTLDWGIVAPCLLLKRPSDKGDRWTYGDRGKGGRERVYEVEHLGTETIEVPAGRHECIVLRMTWNAGDEPVPNVAPTQVVRTLWLARGTGLVRERVDSVGGPGGATQWSRELVRVER
ncbi:MAG: hypothetical protein HY720_08415 [Planctomycetes bacterium]|nr:hypothetical protein [Planctomycetota bacterium]